MRIEFGRLALDENCRQGLTVIIKQRFSFSSALFGPQKMPIVKLGFGSKFTAGCALLSFCWGANRCQVG